MAFNFQTKKTATLTATLAGSTKQINVPGVNPDETSADNAASQLNKILAIGNKAVVADNRMILDIKKGVVAV
ncbi:MAG: hypothetical protein IJG33_13525 [Selenomonadaceae bacterium]|nr:hypothetical protein [Selenomonadaceae bacterium]